ncbi:MAG: hypothetical protein ABR585_11775 [Gemmatimonadaceae bacterium]
MKRNTRLASLVLAVIFVACSEAPESGLTAPSKLRAELVTPPPGHAFIVTGQDDGPPFVIASGDAVAVDPIDFCGYHVSFQQSTGFRGIPANQGNVVLPNIRSWVSAPIPKGTHAITFLWNCSPFTVFDVDLSPGAR